MQVRAALTLLMTGLACSAPPQPVLTSRAIATSSEPPRRAPSREFPMVHTAAGEFPLPHGKATIPCSDCHEDSRSNVVTFALTANCNSNSACHEGDHSPSLGANCLVCHPPGRWDAERFDHDRPFPPGARVAGYPLTGKHKLVRCEACHPKYPDFSSAPTTCAGCHPEAKP
jgi:hypothetical protein